MEAAHVTSFCLQKSSICENTIYIRKVGRGTRGVWQTETSAEAEMCGLPD